LTQKIGEYEIWCRAISKTGYASIYACDVLKNDKTIEMLQFRVYKSSHPNGPSIYSESYKEFDRIFHERFSYGFLSHMARGNERNVAENLELLIRTLIKEGLWSPEKKSFKERIPA
jgi:hypothetical protein